MNKFSGQQIEEFKKLDNLYKKNAELLCYEEILEDEAKTLFLTKQNSKIKKIVFLFAKLRELEKQKEEIKALINDNNFIELVKQEQNVLEEQIANCEDDLQQEYNIYLNNKEEITIEMFNIENGDKILEILKQSIINNCKKNNFQYCLNDDGLSFRVVGYNSFNIFEKLCGVHKSEDEKQVAKLIVYYTINGESFNEKDEIKIDVYKSSGAGGQHINKTESAIRATHIKTGIVVTCQDERTQFQNKEKALFNLKVKVNEYYKQKYEQDVKNSKEKQLKETTISKVVLKYNFNTNKVEGLVNTTFNDFINAKY